MTVTNMKGNAMTDMLQEYCDSRGAAIGVDRASGVIRGVKLLGLESRNGRTYLPEALAEAAKLYEDAKVNVNHPTGRPDGPRDYRDRIGMIRAVRFQSDAGLFGDFHFNPKHALAEQLLWDAEHAPENVGFSHNVEARLARRGERTVVEAITRVQSVDLVADPATTRGLFESVEAAEIKRLQEEVERFRAREAAQRKRETIRRLLEEFHLPDPESTNPRAKAVVGEAFVESLMAAADDRAMRRLVEERARLVRALGGEAILRDGPDWRPQSREQRPIGVARPTDAECFVKAIT